MNQSPPGKGGTAKAYGSGNTVVQGLPGNPTVPQLRNQLKTLKAERDLRLARGVSVPGWFDHVILNAERALEDAQTEADGTDDQYTTQGGEGLPWYAWTLIVAGVLLLAAGVLWVRG